MSLEEEIHEDEDEASLERLRKRSATSSSRVYQQECTFCERPKHGNRTLDWEASESYVAKSKTDAAPDSYSEMWREDPGNYN